MSRNAGKHPTGEDEDLLRMRAEARLHGDVVPAPFVGTTWQTRGSAYWRRRIAAVALFVALSLFTGFFAAAFTLGIAKGTGSRPVGLALAVTYDLTAVLGIITGLRRVSRAPADGRGAAPRTVFPSGCLAFLIAPFGVGLCLAVLLSMFGRDFIGERRAREVTESMQH